MIQGWKTARWLWPLLFLTGCNRSDAENLAAIGHILVERSCLVSDNLEQTWLQFTGQVILESRVKTRLHWDKSLAEASIEVHATDKAIELKGNVASQEQLRRAVELAESTLGVEKVINSLEVHKP